MAATYKQFLAAPNPALLASAASLHYVTTTTSFHGAEDIIKHLKALQRQVHKKKEDIINVVDGQNVLALEVDTTLEFRTSGGTYLPGLDDNFLTDHTVYLPIVHIVTLDGDGKIAQIRLQWDQGSLLKQLEIIGRTGRNWPIKDSREQLTLIHSCIKSAAATAAPSQSHGDAVNRARGTSTNATRDPHASLHRTASREEQEAPPEPRSVVSPYAGHRPQQRSFADILGDGSEEGDAAGGHRPQASRDTVSSGRAASVVSPYAGHRPQQRSFTDVLGDGTEEGQSTGGHRPAESGDISSSGGASSVVSPYAGQRPGQRSFTDILGDGTEEESAAHAQGTMSPTKTGGGRNYQPMRLFDGQQHNADDDMPKGKAKEQYIRPNPTKFSHFDFADGSDPNDAPKPGVAIGDKPKSKHDSQWSFDDFVTPQKAVPSRTVRHQDVRHWDTEKNNLEATPIQAGRARRDAETHFELKDDGEKETRSGPPARPRGSTHNDGLGLYKNQLFNQEEATPPAKRALGNITNLKDRGKDFEAHWEMTDNSPAQAQIPKQPAVGANRMRAVKMMDANWSNESPGQKENQGLSAQPQEDTKIHTAGDGMGGKKGSTRNYLYGDDEDEGSKAVPTRKVNPTTIQKHFWEQ